MCDYSLGGIQNRLAMEEEELVVHRFPTHSLGLASPSDLGVAVCIPPGASLVLNKLSQEQQARWNVGPEAPVMFTQISMEVNRHRDAVRFADGRELLLQELAEGIRVKVVSLGANAPVVHEAETVPFWA